MHVRRNHWTLICVTFEESTIQYYDSCGGDGQEHMNHVLHYLQDEHQHRWGSSLPLPSSGSWRLRVNETTTPPQDNAFDCGVFVCAFADLVLQGQPVEFNHTDAHHYRRRMANAILMGYISLEKKEREQFVNCETRGDYLVFLVIIYLLSDIPRCGGL